MANPNFEAFLKDVLLPLQANAPMNMQRIPVPDHVSEEAKMLLNAVKGPGAPLDVENPEIRQQFRGIIMSVWQAAGNYLGINHTCRVEEIGGVPCRIFTPEVLNDNTKKLLYLHGGGYWLGSAEANASAAINMAHQSGLEVISIDYRLAPEHPFPAAQNDVVSVYEALLSTGTCSTDMSIFGDSAGGGLTVSAALAIRDKELPMPAALGLMSPWTDLTFSGDSHQLNNLYCDPWLSIEGLTLPAKVYAGSYDLTHPHVSPLFADLSGLPPMVIHVGTREIFLSDATRLATSARKSGVKVQLDVYEAMWHVWHFYPCVPEADEAILAMSDFLIHHMSKCD